MKKLFLTIAAAVLSLGSATAAEVTLMSPDMDSQPEWTGDSNSYSTTVDGFSIVVNKADSSTALIAPTSAHFRVYQGATMTVTAPEGILMTKVTFTDVHTAATELAHAEFSEGWTAFGELTKSSKAEEFGATSDGLNSITLTAKKQIRVSNLVVEYEEADPSLQDAGLSFPEATYDATLGMAFVAPVLTKATTAEVVYSSSNEEVATVNATTGEVTLVAAGHTIIKAEAAKNDTFNAGTAQYILNVTDPNGPSSLYSGLVDNGDDWTIENESLGEGLSYCWSWDSTYKYYKASSYVSKVTYEADSYVISPEIDLAGRSACEMTFSNMVNYLSGADVADYLNVCVREIGGEWKNAEVDQWPAGTNWTAVESKADLSEYDGKKIQIAFHYTVAEGSTVSPTWEVYNVNVVGKIATAVKAIAEVSEEAPVYYNLQGVRVANPEKGIYIKVQGNKSTKIIL